MSHSRKDTPAEKPASSAITDFAATSNPDFTSFLLERGSRNEPLSESLRNFPAIALGTAFEALPLETLWEQLEIAVCELDRCKGLQPANSPRIVDEIRNEIRTSLHRRGIGAQAIDEFEAKMLEEKKRADLLTVPAAKNKPAAIAPQDSDLLKKPLLTVQEVMRITHLSRPTVYRKLEEGQLERADTGRKAGKRAKCLIRTESVKQFMEPSAE